MLKLSFDICQKNVCKDLVFSETTGAYNATYNLTGYGSPNITTLDVLTATLTIKSPSLVVNIINLFPLGFPTNNLTIDGYTITSPIALVDGNWNFVYTVTTINATYTTEINKMFTCNSECCVTNMQPSLIICDSCKPNKETTDYITAWSFLQSLKKASECGNITSFNDILKIVTKLCKNSNCKTCK